MSILTRYIALTFLRYLTLSLLSLAMLVVVANFLGKMDRIFSDWDALWSFLDSTARSLPGIVELMLPITVLLAAMFTFNNLSRTSELTAMKSAGMGTGRLLRPLLLVLIPLAAAAYYNQNYLHPWLNPPESGGLIGQIARHQWRTRGDTAYYVDRVDPGLQTLEGVRAYHWQTAPFQMRSYESMKKGTRVGDDWQFEEIFRRRPIGGQWQVEQQAADRLPDREFPDVFRPLELDARHTPFLALYQELRALHNQGHRVALYLLEWYQKPAALFALIVMALIGVSLSQAASRRGRGGTETVATILLGVVFWLLTEIFLMLGKGEYLIPFLAAWMPDFAFFALGVILYSRTP